MSITHSKRKLAGRDSIPDEFLLGLDKSLFEHESGVFRFRDAKDRGNRLHPEAIALLHADVWPTTSWASWEASVQNVSAELVNVVNWYWAHHTVASHYAPDVRWAELAAEVEELKRRASESERSAKVLAFAASISQDVLSLAQEVFGSAPSCIGHSASAREEFDAEISVTLPNAHPSQSGEHRAALKTTFYEAVLRKIDNPYLNHVDFVFQFQ